MDLQVGIFLANKIISTLINYNHLTNKSIIITILATWWMVAVGFSHNKIISKSPTIMSLNKIYKHPKISGYVILLQRQLEKHQDLVLPQLLMRSLVILIIVMGNQISKNC